MEILFWAGPALLLCASLLLLAPGSNRNAPIIILLMTLVTTGFGVLLGLWQAGIGAIWAALCLAVLGLCKSRGWQLAPVARYCLVLGTLSCAALAGYVNWSAPIRSLPHPDGSFQVGVVDFVIEDESRPGLQGAPHSSPRKLLVRAYYPADSDVTANVEPYMTAQEAEAVASGETALGEPGVLNKHLQHIPTHTYRRVSAASGRFPVVIRSNGFSSHVASSTILHTHLASHGYVVFSLTHPGDMSAVVYPDGSVHPIAKETLASMSKRHHQKKRVGEQLPPPIEEHFFDTLWRDTEQFNWVRLAPEGMHRSHATWMADIGFLADQLFANQLPADAMKLLPDLALQDLAFAGTSFGGTASVAACHRDSRCRAAINIDGANFDPELVNATVRMPALSLQQDFSRIPQFAEARMHGIRNPRDTVYEKNQDAGLTGLVERVEIKGMRHQSFSDSTWFARGATARGITATGALSPERTVALTTQLVTAFLDEQIKRDGGAFAKAVEALPEAEQYSLEALREWALARPD
ncbi:hypothetical protein EY643_13655 [Halioglobus maricola]|uniref:Carboxylic ester hydrolase n=1 Tax=Halioglobus maricola TaxID=2601894 RepID=A0A5P9NM80_9GAMM|nr:hypothetical protein [Halioglobus maricola]QFU76616.1 hypothetical protein EY643_13655 [Halioglobus maricola]